MKDNLILIDIDHTLFDAERFKKKLFSHIVHVLLRHDMVIDEATCESLYKKHAKMNEVFMPEQFVEEIFEEIGIDNEEVKKELLAELFAKSIHQAHLFEDTVRALHELEAFGKLGIFSQGNRKFQLAKLQEIQDFFAIEHIHIVVNKKNELRNIFEKYHEKTVVFIDDALPVLFEVKQLFPDVYTIWMKRGKYAENQNAITGFEPDSTVSSLEEAVPIVKERIQ